VAGSKRERDLHRQKLARQQKEAAQAAEARGRRLRIVGVVVGVLLVVGVVAGIAVATSNKNAKPTATPTTPQTPAQTPKVSPSASAKTAAVTCVKPDGIAPGTKQYTGVQNTLIPNGTYTERVTTNCGAMEFALDSKNAPKTVAAMTFLSDRGYYDHTMCHRLTTANIFVIQCGDPKGNGTGGPGFTIPDENLPKGGSTVVYKRGTVAMANSGPGTTGSQFFILYKDSPLAPSYTVVGTVTKGIEIADYVASKGVKGGGSDGPPNQPLQIVKMISAVSYPATQ